MKRNEELANEMLNRDLGVALEMATYFSRDTGLKKVIWIDNGAPKRSIPHNKRRVKYGPGEEVEIAFFPDKTFKVVGKYKKSDFSDIDKVQEWILLNWEALNKLYTGEDEKGNAYTIDDFDKEMKSLLSIKVDI